MHYYWGFHSQVWVYKVGGDCLSSATFKVVFPECTCGDALDHTTSQSAAQAVRDGWTGFVPLVFCFYLFFQVRWVASALSVDFVFHPATPTAAAPTLSFGALVNVIGDEAALPLRARHIFVIVALEVLGRMTRVLCLHVRRRARVQFGNVAKGVRSLHGVRRDGAPHLWFWSAAIGLCFSPGWHVKAIMVRFNPRCQEMLSNELLLSKMNNSKDLAA